MFCQIAIFRLANKINAITVFHAQFNKIDAVSRKSKTFENFMYSLNDRLIVCQPCSRTQWKEIVAFMTSFCCLLKIFWSFSSKAAKVKTENNLFDKFLFHFRCLDFCFPRNFLSKILKTGRREKSQREIEDWSSFVLLAIWLIIEFTNQGKLIQMLSCFISGVS